MTPWLKAALGVATCVVFVTLFWVASRPLAAGFRPATPTPTPDVVKRGNYERYLYGISRQSSGNKKLAQFDPTLPAEDTVVIAALKSLAKDGLGVDVADDVQPVVESIAEVNYITFVVGTNKLLFELFRNSSGQVGTVRFWKQPL